MTGPVHLIVTADDFGLTDGVCRGIVRAARDGVVTSVSAMTRVPGADVRIREYAPELAGRLGVHLQLTAGVPVLAAAGIRSLVTDQGVFPKRPEAVAAPDPDEVYREWKAQIEFAASLGFVPAHLDSHHHVHAKPELEAVFASLAREYGLPGRAVDRDMALVLRRAGVPCPDWCETGFFGPDPGRESLLAVLGQVRGHCAGGAAVELMTHPGYADAELAAISSYRESREAELAALCAPGLADELAAMGFTLARMAELPRIAGRSGA